MRSLLPILLLMLAAGCRALPQQLPDETVDARSLAPLDRLDSDLRWSNAVYRMAFVVKAPCPDSDPSVWQACAIAHLVAVLPQAAAVAPHCRDTGGFAPRFSCIARGAAAAEVMRLTRAGDVSAFIAGQGPDPSGILPAAERAIRLALEERCTETAWRNGCLRREAEARLGASPQSVKQCAVFSDDWEAASCLIVGRMSAFINQHAAAL